ncbi:cytosolic carboxypeptidase-like protein 5 isoform X2 [Cephus cinctus]|uniref:tubulin-glutamate carboxypeptidase n=1 Tax=Cephus cinctus TaxID=211228 RepID=A0AAJ7BM14_CEPCN|nr:cytosolic carboxypeptidase-like protein 5 isoform X2 [Cephus cinctus]
MATATEDIICGSFVFYNNFDSANLAKVEQVKRSETTDNDGCENEGKSCKSVDSEEAPDYEFNVWTKHDCHGTEFQNSNRTWFHFGVKASVQGAYVKINVVNLNKQVKMFSQGMCPVYKTIPGHPQWERIREKPTYSLDHKGSEFTLSFVYRTSENPKAITYIAFTYPFTYTDLQQYLKKIGTKMIKKNTVTADDIYYHRECATTSLEGRRLDLLTISSHHNISTEREDRLKNMFPEKNEERPFKFKGKKVIFVSARVHPGETPSSFVFNGFLNLLLTQDDPMAINLRRLYVFKMIPMLNPDGVVRGHYRMDTRGVNLNRVYLNPSVKNHPTIYAARALIRYYHYCYELPDEMESEKEFENISLDVNSGSASDINESLLNVIKDTTNKLLQQVTSMTLDEKNIGESESKRSCESSKEITKINLHEGEDLSRTVEQSIENSADACNKKDATAVRQVKVQPEDSGLFLYIDLHGHASKKGVFMYGNYFDDPEDTIMCMLLPKLMSINNPNFHFTSCNFAERNMYLIDKRDGMSREGSGRVAVHKLTGLVRSYTLECNYNSGRLVNSIPAKIRDGSNKNQAHMFVPPKYTPAVFEEVGAALGPSILDMTNNNPNSRLPNSQYRSLRGVRTYLKLTYVNNFTASFNKPLNKNATTTTAQDTVLVEALGPKLGCVPEDDGSSLSTSELNPVKRTSKARRPTSLYTVVKRIKSTKKPRQIVNSKTSKSQAGNNMETIAMVVPGIGIKKKLFKPSDYYPAATRNLENIRSVFPAPLKWHKRPGRKLALNNVIKKTIQTEQTSIIKQGTKRLKVVSPKLSKTRPEIGESSKASSLEKTTSKASSKALFLCNKQSAKSAFGRARKQCMKIEQTKSNKSSKIKAKNLNQLVNDKSLNHDLARSEIID